MFLDNYYRILGMYFAQRFDGVSLTLTNGVSVKAYYYNVNTAPYNFCMESLSNLSTNYGSNGVIFGDGTTPPAASDYCLSGNVVTGIVASSTRSATCTDNGSENTVLFTITNNNIKSVTISEVGYVGYNQYYTGPTGSGSYSERFLLDRTLLESPITIEPGGVGQVTYTLRMNYPT